MFAVVQAQNIVAKGDLLPDEMILEVMRMCLDALTSGCLPSQDQT